MANKRTIIVKGSEITVIQHNEMDYISLTDMVKGFGDDTMIYSWMRNRNTVEYIGIWEELNNPDFKGNEFVTFKIQAGLNSFNLTPRKWIDATNAIGFISSPWPVSPQDRIISPARMISSGGRQPALPIHNASYNVLIPSTRDQIQLLQNNITLPMT
jgi:hypothetical protein